MPKYSMIAEVTMEDGKIEVSKKFDHIGDDIENIIHGRMFNMSFEELNKEYEQTNLIIFAFELQEFVEDYMMKNRNVRWESDMKSFKFIFVNNETNEYSHYIEMKAIIITLDYDITLHKIENEDVIKKCVEMVENNKDVSLSIYKNSDECYLKMKFDEIIETHEYYCFKKDFNELKISKNKIGVVTVDIRDDGVRFIWICNNGTIIEIQ